MKFLGLDRLLCLSPHPDDVEFGMSGTVRKYAGTEFTVVTLSVGSKGDPDSGRLRREEVRAFWEAMREDVRTVFADTPFVSTTDEEEWIHKLEEVDPGSYDMVLVPPLEDSHYEHRIVHNLGHTITRSCSAALMCYQTPSTLTSWRPNLLVDVGDHWVVKRDALECFESQWKRPYFRDNALAAFHMERQAAKKGHAFVEQFRVEALYL